MAFMRRPIQRAVSAANMVHDRVRPIYEAARPVLRHAGIDTAIPDQALSTYDGIRRSMGR